MKKLIVMVTLALCSAFAFADEPVVEGNYVEQAIAEYDDLMAQAKEAENAAKAEGITKDEKASLKAEAKALKAEAAAIQKEVVSFGTMFSAISYAKTRGVYVIPEEFRTRYIEATNAVTDVYNMQLQIKWPYLKAGIRNYITSNFKGYFVMSYDENGTLVESFMTIKNSKTGALHTINFDESNYWLIGKSNKYIARTIPSVYFEANEFDAPIPTKDAELHETFVKLTLAGGGTCAVKSVQTTAGGCNACGQVSLPSMTTCVKMKNISGFATGKMKCECEGEGLTHTLIGGACGLDLSEGTPIFDQTAAFSGKFSGSYNTKASK